MGIIRSTLNFQNGFKAKSIFIMMVLIKLIFGLSEVQCANIIVYYNNPIESHNVTVSVGDRVTWVTNDIEPHTITSHKYSMLNEYDNQENNDSNSQINNDYYSNILNSPAISSRSFVNSKQYSFTFTHEGVYQYHCKYNPKTMFGEVRVVSASNTENFNLNNQSTFSLVFACILGFLIFFIFS
ncbi:hypothetical protein DLAC_06442 [Tieghemostelium lacteum]|uniref:Blue (type 1) copper domain-containing protein n=1 Tax=Tieghemostelium lacteum TaxID=361077 RepID=A0A151ZEW5_TIELA|nr:hypothetical protein DLAC_06442 [Tieghemostelium lacteum]|eukprot:KYQ92459.1 hypothetical protein DLAC_06442 [Tieghemostelium lacteum]